MKRNALSLLLFPYKNGLMPRAQLKVAADFFADNIISLCVDHPHLRLNLVLPGYILEIIDPLLLSQLREICKRGNLEWLLTGYTEPFLSFSPRWLTSDNIRHGLQTFNDFTGETPAGFLPPFANWEPSYTEVLKSNGMSYIVLPGKLLPNQLQNACGYWITEYAGNSLALFPSRILHHHLVPADMIEWLANIYNRDTSESNVEKLLTIQYMIPLSASKDAAPYTWLAHAATEIDKQILSYQPVLFREAHGAAAPLGLQYIPPSLPCIDRQLDGSGFFLNRLHSFDQIGILQRKLMEICDIVANHKDARYASQLRHQLYFLQDINRFLPAETCGFSYAPDRLWSFARLIDLETQLHEKSEIKGGQIRIADFLRNGNKCIIMANRSMKAYIDHRNGGQIFELDFKECSLNLCATYNPVLHARPAITSPGKSKTSFIDHILPADSRSSEFINFTYRDLGNFSHGRFEYKVKKTTSGVKTILNRQGSFLRNDRNCPLSMEKVFGLDKDNAELSFVYQLSNHSLLTYDFRFAFEISFMFPGALSGNVKLISNRETFTRIGWEHITLEKATKWHIEDSEAGLRLQFVTQKPLDIWCLPTMTQSGKCDPSHGVTLVLTSPATLEESSVWTLMGKLIFKKIRKTGVSVDEI